MARLRVEPLSSAHDLSGFRCGSVGLDEWLRRHAPANHQAGGARVYVAHRAGVVVAFHALAAGSVEPGVAPERMRKGLPRQPIPVILLARLAVDEREQGRGVGAAMLRDALRRALSAAEEIGARAVLVHAKDADAKAFYEHFGFVASPTDDLHLILLMKDLRALA